jgi:hypothetical protein
MKQIVMVPISVGELIDKITILEIKQYKTTDIAKLKNIILELGQLNNCLDKLVIPKVVDALRLQLKQINSELWDIEDSKRQCEKQNKFDSDFIALARSVYIKNDSRAAIKRNINELTDSAIIEEKIY